MKPLWLPLATLSLILSLACQPVKVETRDYTRFRSEDPASILVIPVANRTVDVTAAGYLLSTLSIPVAERGYYVFPTFLVKRLLEDDGLSDANLVHKADPRRLGELFGTDAILYVTINKWAAQYAVLTTSVEVDFDYVLKSGRTGEELWKTNESFIYAPGNQSSGNPFADLIAMAVTASVTKAAPNFMPLAHQANQAAFLPAHRGFPAGPFREEHGKDKESF